MTSRRSERGVLSSTVRMGKLVDRQLLEKSQPLQDRYQ